MLKHILTVITKRLAKMSCAIEKRVSRMNRIDNVQAVNKTFTAAYKEIVAYLGMLEILTDKNQELNQQLHTHQCDKLEFQNEIKMHTDEVDRVQAELDRVQAELKAERAEGIVMCENPMPSEWISPKKHIAGINAKSAEISPEIPVAS
jgi:hypothetical protein